MYWSRSGPGRGGAAEPAGPPDRDLGPLPEGGYPGAQLPEHPGRGSGIERGQAPPDPGQTGGQGGQEEGPMGDALVARYADRPADDHAGPDKVQDSRWLARLYLDCSLGAILGVPADRFGP